MKINESKTYAVKLMRPVKRGPHTLRPLNEIEMPGRVLKAIIDQEGEEVIDHARQI